MYLGYEATRNEYTRSHQYRDPNFLGFYKTTLLA